MNAPSTVAGRVAVHARRLAWLAAFLLLAYSVLAGEPAGDPFAFFQPDVTLTVRDRARLDAGETVIRILPSRDGQLAVFGATVLDAGPRSVAAWTRTLDHRFSDPPVLQDLDALVLDERDLDALRDCTPGNCRIKLAAPEIASLKASGASAGGRSSDALQRWFREVVLGRVLYYRAGGISGIWPYVDRPVPMRPGDALGMLVTGTSFLHLRAHAIADDLVSYPYVHASPRESILYWSKEQIGGVAAVTVTHLRVYGPAGIDPAPSVLIAGVEIYASHYRTGSLTVIGIVGSGATRETYLSYLNRSQVDTLRGPIGKLRRRPIERRVQRETVLAVRGLRQRLERAGGK